MPAAVAVISRDGMLVADVQRLCALAGADTCTVQEAAGLPSVWRDARLVLVDAAVSPLVTAAGLPARRGVVLVVSGAPQPQHWDAAAAIGARHLVEMPAGQRLLCDLLVDGTGDQQGSHRAVAVVPACGGAGASTLAVGVALRLAGRGVTTTLVDADPAGGGLDLLLGAERTGGLRWPDLDGVRAPIGPTALRDALVHVDGAAVLSGGRGAPTPVPDSAVAGVLDPLRRAGVVVVDARRVTTRAPGWLRPGDTCLLVVPPTVRAVAAAAAAARELSAASADVRLVARGHRDARLSGAEVGRALGLPVVAELPADPSLAAAADDGRLPHLLGRSGPAARRLDALVSSLDLGVAA